MVEIVKFNKKKDKEPQILPELILQLETMLEQAKKGELTNLIAVCSMNTEAGEKYFSPVMVGYFGPHCVEQWWELKELQLGFEDWVRSYVYPEE